MPDLGDKISFTLNDKSVRGGGFLQSYALAGATELGRFDDGRLAVAEHKHGSGRTLLVGTNPGIAYFQKSEDANKAYFRHVVDWAGKQQRVSISDNRLQARLHEADGRRVLWVINPLREAVAVDVKVDGGVASFAKAFWGEASGTGKLAVPPRDIVIVELGA